MAANAAAKSHTPGGYDSYPVKSSCKPDKCTSAGKTVSLWDSKQNLLYYTLLNPRGTPSHRPPPHGSS
jgi:hypothetical protein